MDTDYSWFGCGNIYNAARMWLDYKKWGFATGTYAPKDSYAWRMYRFTGIAYNE